MVLGDRLLIVTYKDLIFSSLILYSQGQSLKMEVYQCLCEFEGGGARVCANSMMEVPCLPCVCVRINVIVCVEFVGGNAGIISV